MPWLVKIRKKGELLAMRTLCYGIYAQLPIMHIADTVTEYDELKEIIEEFLEDWYRYPSPYARIVSKSDLGSMADNLLHKGVTPCVVREFYKFYLK